MKKFSLFYGLFGRHVNFFKKTFMYFSLFAVFCSSISMAAFNNKDFKNRYSFKFSGLSSMVSVNDSTMIATGQIFSDGAGNVTGHGIFRSAGITCISNISGTYNIEPNGSGILSTEVSSKTPGCATQSLNFSQVLSDKGRRIDVINNDQHNMTGQLTQQGMQAFKHSDLNGTYVMHFEGSSSIVNPDKTFTVGLGILGADGNGNIGGTGILRSAGVFCKGIFTGTYHVESDGTGTILTKFTSHEPACVTRNVSFSMVLFKKGNGAELSSSENDYLTGSLHRQLALK